MPFPSRILIVEDEEVLAENLKTLLRRHTADVRIAGDGRSAVDMLRCFTPDLVVVDYALPGIDGLRTYAEISRATSRRPACVMISGYLTDLIEERARRLGVTQLLCKPFSFAELKYAISLTLEENCLNPLALNRRQKERRHKQLSTTMANRRLQLSRRAPAAATAAAS